MMHSNPGSRSRAPYARWMDPEGLSIGNPYYYVLMALTAFGVLCLVWSLTPWFPAPQP